MKRALMKPGAETCCRMRVTGEADSLEMRLNTDVTGDVAGGVGELDCKRYEALGVIRVRRCSCF